MATVTTVYDEDDQMGDVCEPQGLCLLQQQLLAASITGFQNLVSTTHNQDLEYLKMTQLALLAVLGNPNIVQVPTT